jgi:two-component system sensor histidine kinase KdpD
MGTAYLQSESQKKVTMPATWRRGSRTELTASVEFILGGAFFILVTFAAWMLHLMLPAVAPVYFLIIVLASIRWGFWEATVTTLVAVACLDYLFTEPLYSFRTTTANWVALGAFEFTSHVVSRLAAHAQEEARIATRERNNMARLYELGQRILLMDRHAPAGPQIADFVQKTIEAESVVLYDAATDLTGEAGTLSPALRAMARDCWTRNASRDDALSRSSCRVLSAGTKGIGVLGISGAGLNPLVVDSVSSIAAVALERSHALEKEAQAEAARQSDRLRTAVLDALAHAFKTPLTAIRAASSGLLEASSLDPRETELISLIDEQSEHLNDLATRLLQTARLDRADMKVRGEQRRAAELIDEVLSKFPDLGGHSLIRSIPGFDGSSADPMVFGNGELIGTAITQLVDNAIKYSNPRSPIGIAAAARPGETVFAVHNQGPAIRPEDRERIFERFYRSPEIKHRAAGTGLGLSITKKVAEAHHGRVWVTSSEGEGTTFYLAFPANGSRKS